ncbi:hypothetical protein LPS07_05565 [Acinetobacter pittii]|uniref:hypothetical protein n=1 Tax=Acinetobacter pittii TaxID=48296 RepID=UPI001E58F28C|nr:hypothetical protein [Acinetobacter pittii]MDP7845796.1 hypothetical protein [Acinetobacter pittii]MDP7869938.1 hypothetical protein [Acinetobacter pittii]UFN54580.1 hypothetical protein LPS07_05565 [Acinetobacter pittii]
MKIGCIGGVKHGTDRNVLTGYDKTELDWEIKTELPMKPQVFDGRTLTINLTPEYQVYQLKVLKKHGELKYFYVLKDLPREEIETGLADCWELSDNLGYDFD